VGADFLGADPEGADDVACWMLVLKGVGFERLRSRDEGSGAVNSPTQYITKIAPAIKLFLLFPATFAIPTLTIRLVTGAKNPISV
jgi:hypothetical protein